MKKIIFLALLSACTAFAQLGVAPALIGRGFTPKGEFEIQVESGPLEIESSTNLTTWNHLMNGRDTVLDKTSTNAEWRFYRSPGVSNIIGFVRIPVDPFQTVLVAPPFHLDIHLDKPGVRKAVFGTETPPVQFFVMKNGKQVAYTYDEFSKNWSPTPPSIPWGEGFSVRNDSKERIYVRFWGNLPQGHLTHSIPKGESMIGAVIPKPGPVHEAAGAKGVEGAQLMVWDEQKQAYQTSTFNKSTGRWDPPLHYKPGRAIVAKYPEASTQTATLLPSKAEEK